MLLSLWIEPLAVYPKKPKQSSFKQHKNKIDKNANGHMWLLKQSDGRWTWTMKDSHLPDRQYSVASVPDMCDYETEQCLRSRENFVKGAFWTNRDLLFELTNIFFSCQH